MRVSERQIRQMIREEARRLLNEMGWGRPGSKRARPGNIGYARGIRRAEYSTDREIRSAERLATSSGWAKQAENLLKNFPVVTWTCAYIGSFQRDGMLDEPTNKILAPDGRVTVLEIGDGLNYLLDLKASQPENFANINVGMFKKIGPNDFFIFYSDENGSPIEYMATIWKAFHGMFDSSLPHIVINSWPEVEKAFAGVFEHFGEDAERILANCLTMGAARAARKRGYFLTPDDMVHDLPVQQLLVAQGFHFNPKFFPKLPVEDQEVMNALIPPVRAAAAEFIEYVRGKFIMVEVDVTDGEDSEAGDGY